MDWEFRVLDSIQKYFSGNFMDNIMPKISSLGNAGLIWIIFTIVMLLFKNTRKYGYTCGLSLIIMLFTGNIFIKNIVCRLRPFQIRDYINLIINLHIHRVIHTPLSPLQLPFYVAIKNWVFLL